MTLRAPGDELDLTARRPAPLRIGLLAPPWVPVPPPEYGGTELVIDQLARGLTAAGHHVVLFTTGDSTCPVERHWSHGRAVGTTGSLHDELGHVRHGYESLHGCDVIHDHTLLGPLWAIASGQAAPVVTTVHGELTPDLTALYETVAREVAVVAISGHQRSTRPALPVTAVIHHGIDVASQPVGDGDGGYVVFLGRMHPDKGVHRAIEVARKAGRKLLIAAKMWEPAERRYFAEVVEPMLGPDAVYLGQAGGDEKRALLAGAEALINPIRWPEPFGLVMVEALAAGTPVLAFAEGAAPEIVDHGRTGFLCTDVDDMADHLSGVGRIDRAVCRADALARFSTERMVRDHVALYRRLIEARHRRVVVPSSPARLTGLAGLDPLGDVERPLALG